MEWPHWVSIIIAAIAAVSSYLSSRSSSKTSLKNAEMTSRVDLETEAYVRARAYDVATIQQQNHEIEELRRENTSLTAQIKVLGDENSRLKRDMAEMRMRLNRLEEFSPALEELLRKRLEEHDDSQ